MGTSPNSLVAFVGPHSPLAQSGRGTITVCNSSHAILNLQTLLNFMGSPVKYSLGVTALAKISSRKAPLHGACTRNATVLPTTDWKTHINTMGNANHYLYFSLLMYHHVCASVFSLMILEPSDGVL